jgi:hypothetical protein
MHALLLQSDEVVQSLIDRNMIIPILAISGGLVVAIISILATNIRASVVGREREAARREIAAYVAEGSMTPEQAERILAAGRPARAKNSCC